MKKPGIIILAFIVILAGCKTFPETEGYELYRGSVDRLTVWNSDSTFGRTVLVYKPYTYCESCTDSLPTIYIIAPYGWTAEELVSVHPIFDLLDRMLSAQVIPPSIVVVMDNYDEELGGVPYTGETEGFMLENVLEAVRENYHVFADSSYNAVVGIGPMSGYSALGLYFRHPGVFGSAAAHSPMVDPLGYAEDYLLPRALNETGGHLPNPPVHPRNFPHFAELLAIGVGISPIRAAMDSFDLSHQFPIRQIDDSTWLGASLPWDTLGNPIDDSALTALWENASLVNTAMSNIDNLWDTSSVWIDLGRDDIPELAQPIQQLVDSLNAHEKAPVFELYEHDFADPDSVVPVRWNDYLLVRINYSIGHMLKVMWFR